MNRSIFAKRSENTAFSSLSKKERAILAKAFDAPYYGQRVNNPDLAPEKLLEHFVNEGWKIGIDPTPDFSVRAYQRYYADVAQSGECPFVHYHLGGRDKGYTPHSSAIANDLSDESLDYVRSFFDPHFYAEVMGEDHRTDEDALRHFMSYGWREGLDPSVRFSTSFYLDAYPDIASAGLNPILHYAMAGMREGRQAYEGQVLSTFSIADLNSVRPHFDPKFYRAHNPLLPDFLNDDELLIHYMEKGWHAGKDPSSEFSTTFYLEHNPDIAKSTLNPLLHWAVSGEAEERVGHPSHMIGIYTRADLKIVKKHFDAEFYRATYEDVKGTDRQLLIHYMTEGWLEGHDPSAKFSTAFYLETHSDIRDSGANPLLHFAAAGEQEGRQAKKIVTPPVEQTSDADLDAVESLFDPKFYRATNDDLEAEATDRDLLRHYMSIGWREGRDPSLNFSTSHYLETYDDIRGGGHNPFLHFAVAGRKEGRRPIPKGPTHLPLDLESSIVAEHLICVSGTGESQEKASLPASHKINPAAMELHWIVPDFSRGAGGHMTIFRMISYLETFGHRCKIWIENPRIHDTAEAAYQDIIKYFQCVEAEVAFISDGFDQATGDAVIATGWSTAFYAEAATGFAAKYYFVQDHEIEFYPTGTEALMARATYDFDLAAICASPWLDRIMTETYGRWARHFYLAYEHEQYAIEDQTKHLARFDKDRKTPVKIAVYARGHTARRCIDLSLIALEQLAHQGIDFEVHFFGQDRLPFTSAPFAAYSHGVLDTDELSTLYQECDIGICFSATNYSLVPQEMMACGLPLVELDNGSTREIFPEGTVTLAGPAPSDIADKLGILIKDPALRLAQAEAGLKWVQQFTWKKSAREIEAAIVEYLQETTQMCVPAVIPDRSTMLDVIIPTYNGMGELEPVIDALRQQSDADRMQIFCIDSSSSDGTGEWLQKQKDISTTIIEQGQFQHGRTRNDAIALGSSDFIGVLTQDAMPATEYWATDILRMMHHYPDAAGLVGRHLPYPDHPEFVQEEILQHFRNMLRHPLALSKFTDEEKWNAPDRGWHQFLHFYSDNNSAMRRAVWNDIKYPEVNYGEDQVWAYDIIKAGHTKLYAPSVVVYHSHDYNPEQTYARSFTEGEFFHQYFGYKLGDGREKQVANRIKREQANVRKWAHGRAITDEEIAMRQQNIAEKYRGWRAGVAASLEANGDVEPLS